LEVLRRSAQYLEWASLTLITVLSAVRYATPSGYDQPIRAVVEFLGGWAFPLITYLAVGAFALKFLQEMVSRRLAKRQEIKRILDLIHKIYFRDQPEQDRYQHRITLFKACKVWFGRRQYLKIFSRSGSIHLRSRTRLPIDPEGEEGNEGVGGRAWYTDALLVRPGLPEWPATPNPAPKQDPTCQEYSRQGLMSVDAAARLRIKSRSFAATVVRNGGGEKWGALVLDSRDPQGVSGAPEKMAIVRLCADLLTPNLGGRSSWVS